MQQMCGVSSIEVGPGGTQGLKSGSAARGLGWDAGGSAVSWTSVLARLKSTAVASRPNDATPAATAPASAWASSLGVLSRLLAVLSSLELLDPLELLQRTTVRRLFTNRKLQDICA